MPQNGIVKFCIKESIRYVDFEVSLYNAVGDIDLGKYESGSYVSCRATGPFEKGKGLSGTNYYWGKYYSYQIKTAKTCRTSSNSGFI